MAMSTEENIRHYQRSIDRSNGENGGTLDKTRLLHCIQILSKLPVTVLHLQTTGIGRTVNALRKIDDGVGDSAKRLVAKWKDMVANTDTSDEEDEACVPDVPECYESPDCDSETEENERAKANGIQSYEPEALRRPTLSPPLELNIDIGTPESPLYMSDDELTNDEKSKCIDSDSKSKDKSSSSGHSSKSSNKHSSSKDKSSSRKESSSKSSNKDKYKDTNESSKISKSKGSKMNESKNREYSKSVPESSQSSSSSKEKKSSENGKRKYESGSSDGENSIKKRKLSESTDGEEDVQSNNIVIDNQSSDEGEHSKDKESSPKDEKYCDKVKTKDKHHRSSSSKSKSHESDGKYKKDKKHSSSKTDKREKEYKHKSDEHRSKESKSKSSQSSSSSSKDCSRNKSKDKHEKCKKEKEVSATSENDERDKVIKDVKDDKEKRKESKERKEHKESRDSKEQKELKDSKTHKKNKEHKEHTGSKEKKRKRNVDDGIDCYSGTSFADALGMCTTPLPAKKKKETASSSSIPKPSKMDPNSQPQSSKSSPLKCKPDSPNSPEALSLLSPNVKLEPLNQIDDEVDLAVTLPEPSLNYKPLPCKKNSAQLKREEDMMLAQVMYAKNARTKVFSGNKSSGLTKVSSLYDICVRVLTENIDAIEHTGGVPFYILKPVIEQATPDQLFMLEHHNPYLIESTDYLWQFHCQKDFRTKQQEEMESWREMYMRCFDERETKLKALKANIKQSIDNSTPIRTTKLAYVDNIVKPPRNVLRKQAKFGTADLTAKSDLKKKLISPPSGNSGSSGSIASTAERISVPPPPTARMRQGTSHTMKKAKAPLMQKALQAIKGRYKR